MDDSVKDCKINNITSLLSAQTRNVFMTFESLVSKFLNYEKDRSRTIDIQTVRDHLIDCKKELATISDSYKKIATINQNLMAITKGDIDSLIKSYNCNIQRTNRRTGISYTFTVPEKDQLILDKAVTDEGFAEAMCQSASIDNPKDRIIFLSSLVTVTHKAEKSITNKIDKLTQRIKLTKDPNSMEVQIAIKKRGVLNQSLKIINDRLRMILSIFFAIRQQMIKSIYQVSEPFLSLFPEGNEDVRDLSLKFSSKEYLEDLLIIEEKFKHSDKRAPVKL